MEYFLKESLTNLAQMALEEWKMQPHTKPPKEETSVPKTFKV